ncbi:hypothetical protein [Deinococcus wulumuqiensis]|uniref:DUF3168 domain-containing protein n=1 Tax=Deinococcus wulumuqiensis TaxID=980427 RepID=A0AAV4K929_9DEIO|nr:hypothetical protein [Deinococcus wulumuqiensis]QII20048.1 hypothetical protein G6R31_04180 [Deinococcus wulumuqiensis R12]GGI87237.1 hypothetical protein GCM10010914_22110 [Deinococcus wulumuqiensis]GGP29984.1 hypothetical protein GCM10008021_16350 [Deinococcus wulumuqiensis]
METLAQQLQDALGTGVAVYLGSEYLDRQPQLPLVIVLPGSVRYDAPDGSVADALAMGTAETTLVCKAVTFEEAALLADLCYAAIGPGKPATSRLRSETWGDYTVRVADLTITFPAVLTRSDITRVRVAHFTQLAQFMDTPEVVPDDETYRPNGETQFVESD